MQENVLIYILCSIIAVLVLVVILMAMRIRVLKSFIGSRLTTPLPTIKEAAARKYDTLKGFYQLMYLVCDNFSKHSDTLCRFAAQAFSNGSISDLCSDIVHVTNMCEGGAIEKMAKEFKLTDIDTRTCCFIYWGFKWQQTCLVENLTENAYNVRCSRVRKKFNLAKEETIPAFVENYCRDNRITSC